MDTAFLPRSEVRADLAVQESIGLRVSKRELSALRPRSKGFVGLKGPVCGSVS